MAQSRLLAISLMTFAVTPALAQAPQDFYAGRKMDMVIGYTPGGNYDLYARLIARTLGDYLPGNPSIISRNMPGGGSRIAAAWLYSLAPKDGTALATFDQALPIAQALRDPTLRFDVRDFNFIGNPARENNTVTAWHTSGVKTIEDAKTQEVTVGSTGASTSSQYAIAMNALIGTRFKLVTGYPGGNDINLAMERGEVAVRGSNSWASWKSTRADWVRDKKINILVQIGLKRAPDLPNVPLMIELAKNDEDRAIFRLISAPTVIGRPIATAPGVPAERVKMLRDAFDKMIHDPKFIAIAEKEHFEIDYVPGEEMQQVVAEIVNTPEPVLQRLKQIIEASGK
ncbi:MAG: tripartite tricarboxylate transporter substrate-binding protein [Beijerinckiaceae bacterium]|nr:tripartite tricarboxylate transporter substrate-binding protein [Beijerinckiaceae bacterium]